MTLSSRAVLPAGRRLAVAFALFSAPILAGMPGLNLHGIGMSGSGMAMAQSSPLTVDALIDSSFQFCTQAHSFIFDVAARPRELRWLCLQENGSDLNPPVERQCYITQTAYYYGAGHYMMLTCTADATGAPVVPPSSDLLVDGFEGTGTGASQAASNKARISYTSLPTIDMSLNLCLDKGVADRRSLPANRQKLYDNDAVYRMALDKICDDDGRRENNIE